MRAAIAIFPGTNCEQETFDACEFLGFETHLIWHEDFRVENFDLIILPGGFSYGDHISSGRVAKFSPLIEHLKDFDGFILGICNGFQILCEAGLLPGAFIANEKIKFISKNIDVVLENKVLTLPIAHHQGNYFYEGEMPYYLKTIKYTANPNGSKDSIAGVWDTKKNIMGLMPHPERAVFEEQNLVDGRVIFEEIKKVLECRHSLV
ncbi:MAG: phosphoribosylformylglycinamidine synthase I [bacterium]